MSTRDFAKNLIDQIPETRLIYIIPYLQDAAREEIPNEKTMHSMAELDQGGGFSFSGSTEDFFQAMLAENESYRTGLAADLPL